MIPSQGSDIVTVKEGRVLKELILIHQAQRMRCYYSVPLSSTRLCVFVCMDVCRAAILQHIVTQMTSL